MKISEGKIYKVSEIEKILGVSRLTVVRLLEKGRIKSVTHGKGENWRVIGKHLINYLEGENDEILKRIENNN